MTGAVVRKKSWIPWLFVAAFGVIVGVNATMVLFAFGSWRGMATVDSYDKGRRFNHVIAEHRRQAALGWQFAAGLEAKPGAPAILRVELTGPNGAKLDDATVTVDLVRPASIGGDVSIVLDAVGAGRYERAVALKHLGLWELRITARRGADVANAVSRVVLK